MQLNIWNRILSMGSKALVSTLITMLSFVTNVGALTNHAAVASTIRGAEAVIQDDVDTEILWLARAIYSETKIAEEQALVAWVIRNRVESEYYPDSYKEVVLQKGQFSGMHPTDAQYTINTTLRYSDTSPAWDAALSIARAVYYADPVLRPLPANVMHFYSPISVSATPSWAADSEPAHVVRGTNGIRFAFYADII